MTKQIAVLCLAVVFAFLSTPIFAQAVAPAAGVIMKVDPNGPHPEIRRAINALGRAENDLEHAAHDYGGHRAAAMQQIKGAEAELQAALAYKGE